VHKAVVVGSRQVSAAGSWGTGADQAGWGGGCGSGGRHHDPGRWRHLGADQAGAVVRTWPTVTGRH